VRNRLCITVVDFTTAKDRHFQHRQSLSQLQDHRICNQIFGGRTPQKVDV
jgi:hypothetical protein